MCPHKTSDDVENDVVMGLQYFIAAGIVLMTLCVLSLLGWLIYRALQ
jgi:hypothetical protein